jgi:hypothetical protein
MLPLDTSCQAEYEDGYVLDETELNDVSQHVEGKNVFHDILNRLPEAEHGRMVRFSVFWKDRIYNIDWTGLPDNARPIRFRHGFAQMSVSGDLQERGWSGVDFGAQWNDEDGSNQQYVEELR